MFGVGISDSFHSLLIDHTTIDVEARLYTPWPIRESFHGIFCEFDVNTRRVWRREEAVDAFKLRVHEIVFIWRPLSQWILLKC
jgi:hypothetical protein